MINENIKQNEKIVPADSALELVKDEVDRVLSTSPMIIREYTKHLTASRGKFIRAMSLIICAENKDGLVAQNAVILATAIEILHLATLVHDDIIDNADKRRGMVTLQKKYGKRTAVICGDYLLCIALKLAASVQHPQDYLSLDLPDYMNRVCLGELKQHINNGNLDLSAVQYLKIISGKTAALFEASFYAGAILCDDHPSDAGQYMRLGRTIGMIFQLTDDCMDFETTEMVAKKPIQSDYEQGVITLPLIYAFKNLMGFKEKARKNIISRAELNDAVAKTGGLTFTHMISKKYYDKALCILDKLEATGEKKAKLMTVLDKAFRI